MIFLYYNSFLRFGICEIIIKLYFVIKGVELCVYCVLLLVGTCFLKYTFDYAWEDVEEMDSSGFF